MMLWYQGFDSTRQRRTPRFSKGLDGLFVAFLSFLSSLAALQKLRPKLFPRCLSGSLWAAHDFFLARLLHSEYRHSVAAAAATAVSDKTVICLYETRMEAARGGATDAPAREPATYTRL